MLDVLPRTKWFLKHSIREMLTYKNPQVLKGVVEVDEIFVGGKEINKHISKRKAKGGRSGKSIEIGAVERDGNVRTTDMPDTNIKQVTKVLENFVEKDSVILTDES